MLEAGAAPEGAEVAAVEPVLAGQVALLELAEQREGEKQPVSEGEPETEKAVRGEGKAEEVLGEAREAGPVGYEGQAGPGHEAEAVNVAATRKDPGVDSETQSKAVAAGVVKGVSEGAKQGPAVCGSEVAAVLGAGWEAETLMVKPAVELKGCLILLVWVLITVLIRAG